MHFHTCLLATTSLIALLITGPAFASCPSGTATQVSGGTSTQNVTTGDNLALCSGDTIHVTYGYSAVGVWVSDGTFTNSGTIMSEGSSNSSIHDYGVYLTNGHFINDGGSINSGASGSPYGASGVLVLGGTFENINGGQISGNTDGAQIQGGTFINGATITSPNSYGVIMSGGTLENRAGGQISAMSAGVFYCRH